MEYYLFDEKESGVGFRYAAKNQQQAELAYYADFGTSPESIKRLSNIQFNREIFRPAARAINEADCF